MKKYFSLIAVATFAVSSLFVSCDKDETGSTFGGGIDLPTTTTTTDNSSTSSQQGVSKINCKCDVRGGQMQEGAISQAVNNMVSFLNEKLGSTGTATLKSSFYGMTIVMTPSSNDTEYAFKAAIQSITDADITSAVTGKVAGLSTFTVTITLDGSAVLNYEYKNPEYNMASVPTGTWTATVNGTTYKMEITDAKYKTSTKRYAATLTVGTEKVEGYVTYGLNKANFHSTQTKNNDGIEEYYNVSMTFASTTDISSFTADATSYGDKVFENLTFKK